MVIALLGPIVADPDYRVRKVFGQHYDRRDGRHETGIACPPR
jgi:hypothetical protein